MLLIFINVTFYDAFAIRLVQQWLQCQIFFFLICVIHISRIKKQI